jgi:hypothetical protein
LTLANKANGCEGCLLQMISPFSNIAHQAWHKLWPLIAWQFNTSYGGDHLCGSLASLCIVGSKGLKCEVLDTLFGFFILLEPLLL